MFSVEVKTCPWSKFKTERGLFATDTIPAMTAVCLPYMGKIHENVDDSCIKTNKYLFKVYNVGIIDPTTLENESIDHDLAIKSRNFSIYINEPQENETSTCFFTQVGFYMVAVSWNEVKAGKEITALYDHGQILEDEKYNRNYVPGTDPKNIEIPQQVKLPEGMSLSEFEMYCKIGFSMYN